MINYITKIVKPKPYEIDEAISFTCDACKKIYSADTFFSSIFGEHPDFHLCNACMEKIIKENNISSGDFKCL